MHVIVDSWVDWFSDCQADLDDASAQLCKQRVDTCHEAVKRVLLQHWSALTQDQYPWQTLDENEPLTLVVGLQLLSEREMTQVNGDYRQKPQPTNVISFATLMDDEDYFSQWQLWRQESAHHHPGDGVSPPLELGDLLFCPSVVAQEAQRFNQPLNFRWSHLLIHGYLHLLGFDHQTPTEQHIMEQWETLFMDELGYANPYESYD